MTTIADTVDETIKHSPLLETALAKRIINLSALARYIKPVVQQKTKKEIKTGAIIMALKRLSTRLRQKESRVEKILKNISNLTARSNLVEFTYTSSATFIEAQKKLLSELGGRKDLFCYLSQGVLENTVIVSKELGRKMEKIFQKEKLALKLDNLSAITMKLPEVNVDTPGVYYSILKLFMWEDINIVELFSTYTELTLVFYDKDIESAFSLLKNL
jgi:hypothetical protein